MGWGRWGENVVISLEDFSALRLTNFLPEAACEQVDGWEYLDRIWICQMSGFTQFCHLRDGSFCLGVLSIDLSDLPVGVGEARVHSLGLPIDITTTQDDLISRFGTPTNELRFTDDRVTFEYTDLMKSGFNASFTVMNEGGLIYLTMEVRSSE